jgi:hypothetical protein
MLPSGEAVVQTKLWRYYIVEIPRSARALFESQTLGPGTGGSSAALSMLFQHLGFSAIGGLMALGIGWGLQKIGAARRRRQSTGTSAKGL